MFVRVQSTPFGRLLNLEREIGDLFTRFDGLTPEASTGRYPALDLAEYDEESVILAEMPGVQKDDLKISIHDGLLTISGERKAAGIPDDAKWVRGEISRGQFTRVITLPHEVKADTVSASLADGLLRIVLPKADRARPREIKVK